MMPQRLTRDVRLLYETHVRRRGVVIGSMMQALFNKGGVPLIDWLAENTPAGVTMCEVVAGMVMDEMLDEQGKQPIIKRHTAAVFKSVRTKP